MRASEVAASPDQSAVLSKIRHDLKTPLNQIIGYAEMLLEDAGAAGRAEAENSLRRLLDSAQSCLEVQQRLLTRQPEELRAEHFQELKDDQTARSAYMAEILTKLRAEPGAEEWTGDLDRLGIAVWSLGTLAKEAPVKWSRMSDPQTVPVEVQLEQPVQSPVRPTASLELAPEPPAQFEYRNVPPAGVPLAGVRSDGERTRGRLLVVDDNEANRDMLSRRLGREGYSVETALNGRDALEKLEARRVRLGFAGYRDAGTGWLCGAATHSRESAVERSGRHHDFRTR